MQWIQNQTFWENHQTVIWVNHKGVDSTTFHFKIDWIMTEFAAASHYEISDIVRR